MPDKNIQDLQKFAFTVNAANNNANSFSRIADFDVNEDNSGDDVNSVDDENFRTQEGSA